MLRCRVSISPLLFVWNYLSTETFVHREEGVNGLSLQEGEILNIVYREDNRHWGFVSLEFTANSQRGSMGPANAPLLPAMFPSSPSLGQLYRWKQRWETRCEGFFHHWCLSQLQGLLPPIELGTGLPREHGGCPTCSP